MKRRLAFSLSIALFGALSLGGCMGARYATTCGTYPSAPADASTAVYVSAQCGTAEGDGSQERPFASIQQGIDASASGSAVLVDAGTYQENLTISKPVQVIGAEPETDAEKAGIIVQAPEPYAVTVAGASGVVVRGIWVQSPKGAGIWVQKGGEALIDGSKIEGASATTQDGHGVMATDGASIIVQRTIIVQSEGAGVHAVGSSVEVTRSVIEGNQGLAGIWVQRGIGDARIAGNDVIGNAESGISIVGSRAIIVQNQVKDTHAKKGDTQADGIRVVPDAEANESYAEIGSATAGEGNVISGNDRIGILMSGATTRGIIVQNEVTGNADGEGRGAGIWVQSSAGTVAGADGSMGIRIEGNTVKANHFLGIGVTKDARAIIVQNPSIEGTLKKAVSTSTGAMLTVGDGLGVYAGAFAHVDGNKFMGNERAAAVFDAASVECVVTNNLFEASMDESIIVQNQTMLDLTNNELPSGTPDPIQMPLAATPIDASEF